MNYSCYYAALADHRVMKKKGSKNSHTSLEVALRLYQKKRDKITILCFCLSPKEKSSLNAFALKQTSYHLLQRMTFKMNGEMSLSDVLSQASTNPFSIGTFPLGSCTVSSAVLDSEARQQSGNYVTSTQTVCGQCRWGSERSPKPIYTA